MAAEFRRSWRGYAPAAAAHALAVWEAALAARERRAEAAASAARARAERFLAQAAAAVRGRERPAPGLAEGTPPPAEEGDGGPPAPPSLPVAPWGLRRTDVDAYVAWRLTQHEGRVQREREAERAWREAAEALSALAGEVEAQAAQARAGAEGLAVGFPASGALALVPERAVPAPPRSVPARPAARAEGVADAAAPGRAVAARILPAAGADGGWLADLLGEAPYRVPLPPPHPRLVGREGEELGRAAAVHVAGYPPRPLALELEGAGPGGGRLGVGAEDVAAVHGDRVRLRPAARARSLGELVPAAGDGTATPSPVVILVGPCDAFAPLQAVADALTGMPGVHVDFCLYRDGVYRIDGRAADLGRLAALLAELTAVTSVTVEGETVHVGVREEGA
ncbi:MAG: hypothetical protein K6V97_09615 [Actinomycetia bacterium]|nr:hypothetical protein [Actinomycetes bacterium]